MDLCKKCYLPSITRTLESNGIQQTLLIYLLFRGGADSHEESHSTQEEGKTKHGKGKKDNRINTPTKHVDLTFDTSNQDPVEVVETDKYNGPLQLRLKECRHKVESKHSYCDL